MAGNSLIGLLRLTGGKEPFENEKGVSFLLMNNIAHFIKMAGTENNLPASDVLRLEPKVNRPSAVSDLVGKTKDLQQIYSRGEKSLKNYKVPPKRSTAISCNPKYVKNAAFVHKGRQTKGSPLNKSDMRRKSIDYPYTGGTQSTRVYSLDDKKLVYEEINQFGLPSDSNPGEKRIKDQDNTLPPLTGKFENLSLQSKRYRLQTPKERHRSLSGQSATKTYKDKSTPEYKRSASIDYTNMRALVKADSRSSLFAAGPYSQANGTLSTASNDAHTKSNSARSAFSRNKTDSIYKSITALSSMSDASKQNNSDCVTPEHAILSSLKPRKTLRASSVYSPISVASTERMRISAKPNISRRRASLPTTGLSYSNLASETTQSREFFEALNELKQDASPRDPRFIDRKSSPRSSRREILHIIEEISPENNLETAHQKNKDKTESADENEVQGLTTENENAVASVEANGGAGQSNFEDGVAPIDENKKDKLECLNAKEPKKISLFSAPEDNVTSKKIFSRLKNKKQISSTEQNQHFVAETDSVELNVEESSQCLLLSAASAHETDYLDHSVIFKNDDDLCDEDFYEKRIILWLMDVSTGEEAEGVTRTTPPPSPEPGTQESAIRVVYSGDSKEG